MEVEQATAAMAAMEVTPKRTKRLVRKAVECAVCAERFNNTNYERIKCKYCNYESCRTCNTHYMETSGGEAKCMNCQKIWIREDIIDMFGQGFLERVYKPARGKYLYDLAKLQIPMLQRVAALFREMREKKILLRSEMLEISERIEQIRSVPPIGPDDRWVELRQLHNRFSTNLNDLRDACKADKVTDDTVNSISAGVLRNRRNEGPADYAVKKCDCNGMVMRRDMKCGNCSKQYCKDCYEHRDHAHECNQETVATVRLLATDTKPCPKCTCAITKIDGCDQMWCPECRTAFSWRTGKIEIGVIHNPHYYQWMRTHGGQQELERQARELQAAADGEEERVECENISADQAARIVRRMIARCGKHADTITREDADMIVGIGQFALHIQEEEIPKYTRRIASNEKLDVPIIKFLLNDISEKVLVSEILKKDKANSKSRDICTFLQTFRLVCINLCTQISMGIKGSNADMIQLGIRQFKELVEFTNTGFIRTSEIYADSGPLKIAITPMGVKLGTTKDIDAELLLWTRQSYV